MKHEVILIMTAVLCGLSFFIVPARAKYGGGTGEPNDPYLIYDANQMNAIGADSNDWDKHFKLMADINLADYTGTQFNIIGNSTTKFTGAFDGNSYTISNFTYSSNDRRFIGLFGYVGGENAEIKDLGLIDPKVHVGIRRFIGSLVGWLSAGTITNCYVEGGSLSGGSDVGGLVGFNWVGTISNCYSTGSVSGDSCVGGLVGSTYYDTISNCYSTGSVSGDRWVGGLVGWNNRGTITNCYSTGSVTGSGDNVGGLVGQNRGTITNCCSSGSVWGDRYVGGLVGWHFEGTISNCYSSGSISGNEYVGGLVGNNGGCDFWGCGHGRITNCYSSGSVDGNEYVGGLVGRQEEGEITGSFWDIETSGRTTSAGGTGKATAEMQTMSTFTDAGWDFENIWWILEGAGYPKLWWEEKYGGGTGEPNDPYLIFDANQMNAIGADSNDWDRHFILMADIDLSAYTGTDFNIIGYRVSSSDNKPFTGVFDGNGHTISNFTYTSTGTDYIGLFGYVNDPNAEIKDLGLIDPDVDAGAGNLVGSLVGLLMDGKITRCYAEGGSVAGGYFFVGGLAGGNAGIITNCYSVGSVEGAENAVSGLVGGNTGTITYCYSAGRASGFGFVGGLVGRNYRGTITNSYSTGSIAGYRYVGGIVGGNRFGSTISNCYSTGDVIGEDYVGGLVGGGGGTVTASFWDIETSGRTTSDGGTGKTTAEMQDSNTFLASGWDFVGEAANGTEDIWYMPGCGYPALSWQPVGIVPEVTELSQEEAVSVITSAGPVVVIKTGHSEVVPEGYVISLEPSAGCEAAVVTIIVSDGFPYEAGRGTEADPYQIWTAEQMNAIGANPDDWDKQFVLMSDIDMSAYTGTSFNIIGTFTNGFTGVFAGKGHTISNFMYMSSRESYIGLFGCVGTDGQIMNLGLIGVNIDAGTGHSVGGLVGRNAGTISNCYSAGSVSGVSNVGGLVGLNREGTISNSYSTGSISGDKAIGGLVGWNLEGTITDSYSTGSVLGTQRVGGLVGSNGSDGTITNCYSTGSVSGDRYIGGLVGGNYGTITNCYATGSVSGDRYIGGLVGYNASGTISASFWDIETSGRTTSAGGMGLPTVEMKMASTFTDAGWDFVDETTNGTDDIWFIREGVDYPRLWWENHIPVADAGVDRAVEAEGAFGARVTLDGSCSSDADSAPGTNDDIVCFDWYKVDACDPNFEDFLASGEIIDCNLPLGEHIIVLEVIDKADAFDTNEVTIIVQDTTPPVITLNGQAAMTLECRVDSYTEQGATATDICDGNVPVVIGGDTVDTSRCGTYVVTYDATDASGNAAEQVTRTVIVQDTTPPVIALNGPATMTLECRVDSYIEEGAAATDICDGNVPVIIGGDVVDTSACGTYVVAYDATDASGNAAEQVTRAVIVQDTIPPDFTLSVTPDTLWPVNHKMVLITPFWTVSDICDESPEVSLVSITMNEDDEAKGDGHTTLNIQIGDDGSIYLRAERSGAGSGRIYTITYQAVDDSGNAAVASATVAVPHDQR